MSDHEHEWAAWTEDGKIFKCIHCDSFKTAFQLDQLQKQRIRELEAEKSALIQRIADCRSEIDADKERLVREREAAWDSAVHNQKRAEAAESLAATQRELLNEFEDKLNRQDANLRAVGPYLRHKMSCGQMQSAHSFKMVGPRECDCGLEALLKKEGAL